MRKPRFCICENKGADQCAADQRVCFRNRESTIPLLPETEISSLLPSHFAISTTIFPLPLIRGEQLQDYGEILHTRDYKLPTGDLQEQCG